MPELTHEPSLSPDWREVAVDPDEIGCPLSEAQARRNGLARDRMSLRFLREKAARGETLGDIDKFVLEMLEKRLKKGPT